jgi:capsular polysaccharide biosynthesis protein
MTLDIRMYVMYLLKRFWIVVIVSLTLGVIAYRFLGEPDPVYRAEARIFIGGEALSLTNPDVRDIDFGQRLAPTYAQFAKDFDVLTATIEALNLNLSPTQLGRKISTRIILDTAILQISAEDTDPQRAANIANEIARNLILNSPSNLTEDEQLQLTVQTAQIAELEDQIAITREQSLETLQRLNDASDRGDQDEIDE